MAVRGNVDTRLRKLAEGECDHPGTSGHVENPHSRLRCNGVNQSTAPPGILAEAHDRTNAVVVVGKATKQLHGVVLAKRGHRQTRGYGSRGETFQPLLSA